MNKTFCIVRGNNDYTMKIEVKSNREELEDMDASTIDIIWNHGIPTAHFWFGHYLTADELEAMAKQLRKLEAQSKAD